MKLGRRAFLATGAAASAVALGQCRQSSAQAQFGWWRRPRINL
jgi:hypothetical protein